jgi:hypoxanthine phosphoribosyltransferase
VVRIVSDLDTSIEGRDVLLVEDVVDTGTTLAYIVDMLKLRNPGSLEVCALLRKRIASPQAEIPIRYLGREIPNTFVVGYGLDHDENYRNLPFIAALALGANR